jgi:MoaA/NifB/PqqE/SkfB family radical SAM enzyme
VDLVGGGIVRLGPSVGIRTEPFGYLAYVGDRDHFFAIDHVGARVVDAAHFGIPLAPRDEPVARVLARYGVLAAEQKQAYHHGVSLIGDFDGVPPIGRPLVVNCFATAECPLRCRYCYADDLMRQERGGQEDSDIDRVVEMADAVPAMVAVITGGEPLARPDRTERLIRRLAAKSGREPARKALVLDTSGAGDLTPLLPVLKEAQVHVRVSLDSFDRKVNAHLRPGKNSDGARAALARARTAGLATTVQTVVTSANDGRDGLRRMRDELMAEGVRNWVLHGLVPAGKAAGRNAAGLKPSASTRETLADLVRDSTMAELPINIRVTANDRPGNSALIIGSKGDLYVEHDSGKVRVAGPGDPADQVLAACRRHVSPAGHAGRYLNGSIHGFGTGLVAAALTVGSTRQPDGGRRREREQTPGR